MKSVSNLKKINFDAISVDPFWNTGDEKELKMHRIHVYPAKFPAFITTKALEFAKKKGLNPEKVADIFCGCGTVAYEAKRNGIDFLGYDINPVATLIAKAKSEKYQKARLEKYYKEICASFNRRKPNKNVYKKANERLKYWYTERRYLDLHRLKASIESVVPESSKYRLFFLCAFSNILKPTSRWLAKSIKPQIDPNKKIAEVFQAFQRQFQFMLVANDQSDATTKADISILNQNFLADAENHPVVDMIVTSPPYVTSYEYADLHQLSSLWLGYTDDYRELREGSIGSLFHSYNFAKELKNLNGTGANIVFNLLDRDKSQASSVAKYFLDMQKVVKACYGMLSPKGIALFVIGNTEYKGVRIENARHLVEALKAEGFAEVLITKRKITNKFLTPYRDEIGKFTTDKKGRKIYSEEFIVVGIKNA